MNWLRKLKPVVALILFCTVLLSAGLTSCKSQQNSNDQEGTENAEGDHPEGGEHPEGSEHPEGEHPAGSSEHPNNESDSTEVEGQQ